MNMNMNYYKFWILIIIAGSLAGNILAQKLDGNPTRVTGEFAYQDYLAPKYFAMGSTAALLCVSNGLKPGGASGDWVPKSGQIIGRFVSPFSPPPLKFEIDLPVSPRCEPADFDNNGHADAGVQVFLAVNAINMFGDSYLEQLEQESLFASALNDAKTGSIRRGTLLVFAPDAGQKVPSGSGQDGVFFTKDDPTAAVPKGYTLMRIGEDGAVSFDRSDVLKMNILESEQIKSPDFSDQGILQSFDSLVDLLKERYAYTDLRNIDWEKKRADYRPRVAAADAQKDLQEYFIILYEFAAGIRDGHVQTVSYQPEIAGKRLRMLADQNGGSLGAQLIRYSDGRFIIYALGADSPAARAGMKIGTEILKINGRDVPAHLKTLMPVGFVGTEERDIQLRLARAFSFPKGETVAVEFRNPGETAARTARLVAGEYDAGKNFPSPLPPGNFSTAAVGGDSRFGYAHWTSFENIPLNIASLETFLAGYNQSSGVILDLRDNSGGLIPLMYTMASYFFPPEKAVAVNWLAEYSFDDVQKKFLPSEDGSNKSMKIYSPRPEIAYRGNVVILVDGGSASSAELFALLMQKSGRAVVIADSGTDGAGGGLRSVTMPGKIPFTFSGTQIYFAGTRDPALEAKGVIADIRVPIDEEYVRRRLGGEDVVLTAAVKYLENAAKK